MDLLLDLLPEPKLAALFGLMVGAVFGFSAERSSFCLRAATVEFARGRMGPKVAVWLLTFSTAVIWVQGAQALGLFRGQEGVDKTWGSCGAFSVCDGQPTIENCGPCDGYSVSPFGRPTHPPALSHAGIGNVIN